MATLEISDQLYQYLQRQTTDAGISIETWLTQVIEGLSIPDQEPVNLLSVPDQNRVFAKIANTVPYMLYVFDLPQGRNTFINAYTEKFFGLSAAEIHDRGQQHYIDTLHPDDLTTLAQFNVQWDEASDDFVFEREYRIRNATGEYRWLRSYETVLERSPDGVPIQIIGTAIDITEHKQMMLDLAESQAQSQAIFNNALDSILLTDDKGIYIDANPAVLSLLGYTREELIGKSFLDITPSADQEAGGRIWDDFLQTGRKIGQYRLYHKDGSIITVEYMAVRDILPGVHLCILHDISEHEGILNALRTSEARYRAIAEHFPNGLIALYDHDLRYTIVNGDGLKRIGLSNADLEGKRLRDVFPPDIYKRDEPALLAALHGEMTEAVLPFGDEYFHVITLPVKDEAGDIIAGMVMSQNVTALTLAEARQTELVNQLALAIDTAQLGMWTFDMATQKLEWNSQQHEIYGITPAEFAENVDGWREQVHPDDRVEANAHFEKIQTTGRASDVHFRVIRPTGEVRYVAASGRALYDDKGNIVKLIGVNYDVTQYEQAKQAVAASEARYRALFDGLYSAVVVYDEQANFVMVNKAAANGLGLEPDEIVGRPLSDFIPEKHDVTAERVRHVLTTNEIMQVEDYIEFPGGGRWFSSVFQPIRDGETGIHGAQVITNDITEHKQAAQLEVENRRLQEKLERERTITELRSRLISVISHEFRTPLAIIMSAGELLSKYHERLSAEQREQRINNIAEQVHHLAQMLDDISKLSQANRGFLDYNPVPTDIPGLCQRVLRSLQDTSNVDHEFTLTIDAEDTQAMLDDKLMYHALSNLISNAVKYSPDGGEISLSLTQTDAGWWFTVQDQGIGIPEEDQEQLFKPFSRASNVDGIQGTGLGLSIVKEIAEHHGGMVRLTSEIGEGSTFEIFIPFNPRGVIQR